MIQPQEVEIAKDGLALKSQEACIEVPKFPDLQSTKKIRSAPYNDSFITQISTAKIKMNQFLLIQEPFPSRIELPHNYIAHNMNNSLRSRKTYKDQQSGGVRVLGETMRLISRFQFSGSLPKLMV